VAQSPSYPYSPVPNSFKRLLEKIPDVGTPTKVDGKWLDGLGFGGGNNKMSLSVMRHVGIINADRTPTDLYKALRAKDKAKFAAGVRKHYADLFSMYADAQRKDDEALIAFVRSKTDYAEQTQRLAVRTFKVLTEFGDFDQQPDAGEVGEAKEPDENKKPAEGELRRRAAGTPEPEGRIALTVNIQLQLPPSADGEVYDKLFAAMGKHLKGLVSVE
jgi:hypothetical protein